MLSAKKLQLELDNKVKEFIAESRESLRLLIINDYFDLAKSSPVLVALFDKLEKSFDLNIANHQTPDHWEELADLKLIDVKDGKLQDNTWIIYGILSKFPMALALQKEAYANSGQQGIIDMIKNDYLPQLSDDIESINEFARIFDKNILNKYLELLNEAVVSELLTRDYLESQPTKKLYFDNKNSILVINGENIKINKQIKATKEHKLLCYLFDENKNTIGEKINYYDIAEFAFADREFGENPNDFNRYISIFNQINLKIEEATDNRIKKFLQFNATNNGYVHINDEYIEKT